MLNKAIQHKWKRHFKSLWYSWEWSFNIG